MLIIHKGNIAEVTQLTEGDKPLYRLEWEDHSLDFVYKEKGEWKAKTVIADADLEEIGNLIDQSR